MEVLAGSTSTVVVDDGSSVRSGAVLNELAAIPGVTLVRLAQNGGLAAALNRGIRLAFEQGADSVITFDQDTVPTSSVVGTLTEAASAGIAAGSLGVLGPGRIGRMSYRGPLRSGLRYCAEVIQSGMFIPRETYRQIGGFEEDLVIDGVDTQFCLAARAVGLQVCAVENLPLSHAIGRRGTGAQHGILRSRATHHDPDRRYYITRNRILLLRRYARSEPRWAIVTLRGLLVGTAAAVLVEDHRADKLRAVLSGIRDGGRGIVGMRPNRMSLGAVGPGFGTDAAEG